MNDFQTPTQSNSDLSEQVAALRSQLFMLLLALIVVSATVTGYLYLQARHASRDIAQTSQVLQAIEKNRANIHGFVEQLAAYGQKNPAFQQQVLRKYGITPETVGTPKQ
jgi:hypothetical protein